MEEIRYKNAVIRIHGSIDREKIEKATVLFARSAVLQGKTRKRRIKEV